MKPFDLEKAKLGHKVITRDGRNVRIVCFDYKYQTDKTGMLVLVNSGDSEASFAYHFDGHFVTSYSKECENYDLFMAPVGAWYNVYKINETLEIKVSPPFNTEELAKHWANENSKTIYIEFD